MSIYSRMIGIDGNRLPVHQIYSLLHEINRGRLTKVQVGNMLGLSAAEKTEASALVDRLASSSPFTLSLEEFHEVLMIASAQETLVNNPYSTESTLKARIGGV